MTRSLDDIPIPFGFIWKPASRAIVRMALRKIDVRVRVHEARFDGSTEDMFFINVTNVSPQREVKLTHVTVQSDPPVHVVNPHRLMRTLRPDGDSWETWVAKSDLPDPTQDIRTLVDVRISTGQTFRSEAATPGVDVPMRGEVPK